MRILKLGCILFSPRRKASTDKPSDRAVCESSTHTEAQSYKGSSLRLIRSSVYNLALSANACRSEKCIIQPAREVHLTETGDGYTEISLAEHWYWVGKNIFVYFYLEYLLSLESQKLDL